MSSYISTEQELHPGDVLFSNERTFRAVFQNDSNFVVYKWTPIWSSDTFNQGARRMVLQKDSNLVMYDTFGKPIWSTDTGVSGGEFRQLRLTMTNEGKLVLDNDGKGVWNSEQNTGKRF